MVESARRASCGVNCGLIVATENPPAPVPLDDFRLFAVMATRMEADVVAATVKNAFAQGCERVYVIDNGSPDETVEVAVGAGATLTERYATRSYDEQLRVAMLNATVARMSLQDGSEHIWWLYMDADEFSHGPGGMTVREYLAGLDDRFRVVGSRVFNHFPAGNPQYLPGFHPLEFQLLCEEFSAPMCASRHWKHPLQRYDAAGPFLLASRGFHSVMAHHDAVFEPVVPIFTHHFQFRDESQTRRRMAAYAGGGGEPRHAHLETERFQRRFRTLDAVYEQRWGQVEKQQGPGWVVGVHPRPWPELVSDDDAGYARWYSREDLIRARREAEHSAP